MKHGSWCSCTDCVEGREHEGEDFDAWKRAFPDLPWETSGVSLPMRKSEELARAWMPGFRDGPENRPAWMHPQDLVQLLGKMKSAFPAPLMGDSGFGFFGPGNYEHLVDLCWGHDLIEDGKKEDGSPVTWEDLESSLGHLVADGIERLSHKPNEEKQVYLARLGTTLWAGEKIVKCIDRICNLVEGAKSFKPKRWARYIAETHDYIVPLAAETKSPYGEWLEDRLSKAMALRPVERET